ncbi:hypothetical protein ACFWWA_13080 [Streptomyces goshikiensis]|uniref:pPIWI_RE_Y domain-containing protein n=1 Tax=Streptomyces goshikiensis TaxID=1942 RepID=UPI00365F789C
MRQWHQSALDQIVLRCVLQEKDPPESLPALISWCRHRTVGQLPVHVPAHAGPPAARRGRAVRTTPARRRSGSGTRPGGKQPGHRGPVRPRTRTDRGRSRPSHPPPRVSRGVRILSRYGHQAARPADQPRRPGRTACPIPVHPKD